MILGIFLDCSFPSPLTQHWGLMIRVARQANLREESDIIFFCFSLILKNLLVLAIRTTVISFQAL